MGILELKEGDRLVHVAKELGARGKVFICWCRHSRFILCSQRLPCIAKVINQLVTHEVDRVSWQSLYRIANGQLKKRQTKGYNLIVASIETAAVELNRILDQRTFAQAGIVTDAEICWRVARQT